MMAEAISTLETSVNCGTMRRSVPEDCHLHTRLSCQYFAIITITHRLLQFGTNRLQTHTLFCCSCRWGGTTSPKCGHQRVPSPDDVRAWSPSGMIMTWEIRKSHRKARLSATLSTTSPTRTDPGANPGRRLTAWTTARPINTSVAVWVAVTGSNLGCCLYEYSGDCSVRYTLQELPLPSVHRGAHTYCWLLQWSVPWWGKVRWIHGQLKWRRDWSPSALRMNQPGNRWPILIKLNTKEFYGKLCYHFNFDSNWGKKHNEYFT
jgi:hypothetical protein